MSKVVITYELPEDYEELRAATAVSKLVCVVWDFDMQLRNRIKYDEELSEKERELLEEMRTELREFLDDSHLQWVLDA